MLGLAFWTGRAANEVKTYKLTVSVHPTVHPKLTKDEIEGILKGASDILQGHTDSAAQNNCKVEFKFKGFLDFPASAPDKIINEQQLDAVHDLPGDVKVVQTITFCVGEPRPDGVLGCSWRRQGKRTVIVARDGFLPGLGSPRHDKGIGPVLWAHEFGHTTDLLHRYHKGILNNSENLMTPCDLEAFSQSINDDECTHFRSGPATSYGQGGDACPTIMHHHQTD